MGALPTSSTILNIISVWLRGLDLNQGPSGYEPDELPDCSTLQQGRGNVLSGNRPVNVILVLFGIHACQRRP